MKETFGQCLKRFRQRGIGMSQETLAEHIGRVKMTVSQYERGVCAPPQGRILEKIITALNLNEGDAVKLKFLASCERNTVPDDISEYFFKNPIIYEAIRIADKKHTSKEKWKMFIASIEDNNEI